MASATDWAWNLNLSPTRIAGDPLVAPFGGHFESVHPGRWRRFYAHLFHVADRAVLLDSKRSTSTE